MPFCHCDRYRKKLVDQIRPFQNADLPDIADVWIRHWSAVMSPPEVSVAMIEQAIFARTFFEAGDLLVARRDGVTVAWCHTVPWDKIETAIIPAICFSPEGLPMCDALLIEAESRIAAAGFSDIAIGPLRDEHCGYTGLAPVGHGIGIPTMDARTSSLLSRRGYSIGRLVNRLVVSTSTYRPAINRDWMQLRRTTKMERIAKMPGDARTASAMAHLDIEQHRLVDYRSGKELAAIDIWTSDPDAQVMSCAEAILDLGGIESRGEITSEEGFLISSLIQSLANRRVFSVETAIDTDQAKLTDQLIGLGMLADERGPRWVQSLASEPPARGRCLMAERPRKSFASTEPCFAAIKLVPEFGAANRRCVNQHCFEKRREQVQSLCLGRKSRSVEGFFAVAA